VVAFFYFYKMAKDPAFLFYPNDYLGGTMGMTFEQKGAYMELLMLQFNRGHMTKHMMGQVVGQLLDGILDKFEIDEQGLYFNKRLEDEQERRKSFVNSRLNNRTGSNQYTKKEGHVSGHMTSHMENENTSINYTTINPKMVEVFKRHYPHYPVDEKSDFGACLQIAYLIAKQKKWTRESVLNENLQNVLDAWEKIVQFSTTDKWYSTRSISDFLREFQRIVQSMTAAAKPKTFQKQEESKSAAPRLTRL